MPLLLLSSFFQKHWLYNMVDATSIYLQWLQHFTTHNHFCMTDFSCTSTCTIYSLLLTSHFHTTYKHIHTCHVHVTYSPRGCCKLVTSCMYMQCSSVNGNHTDYYNSEEWRQFTKTIFGFPEWKLLSGCCQEISSYMCSSGVFQCTEFSISNPKEPLKCFAEL